MTLRAENREAYQERMKDCPQFKRFGIVPKWFPGTGDVDGFIHDEVVRQYHDTRLRDDGGIRVEWMRAAWSYAQRRAHLGDPDVPDILALGTLIEPYMNHTEFRKGEVHIGGGKGAPPQLISPLTAQLVTRIPELTREIGRKGPHPGEFRVAWTYGSFPWTYGSTPGSTVINLVSEMLCKVVTVDDWYLAFEAIHPFGDGNGRTGKVLHNWLLGTLDDPVLVADYFGGGNP